MLGVCILIHIYQIGRFAPAISKILKFMKINLYIVELYSHFTRVSTYICGIRAHRMNQPGIGKLWITC